MTTEITWIEIALRLFLTVLAGGVIGLNRGEHGRPAGLRTTMLVCLAASVSMIQANLLLATAGKPTGSFITLDLMRLPLGVLTGMGFIGGGAILRRGEAVLGVTTAATLWFVTIMGLCFGGGQKVLGLVVLALGMLVLSSLKLWESHMFQIHRGTLTMVAALDRPSEVEFQHAVAARGFAIGSMEIGYDKAEGRRTLICELRWRASDSKPVRVPIRDWADLPGVERLRWAPQRNG